MFDASNGGNKMPGGSGYLLESGKTGTNPLLPPSESNLFVATVVVCNFSPKFTTEFGFDCVRCGFGPLPVVPIAFGCVGWIVAPFPNRLGIVGVPAVVLVNGGANCEGAG